MRGGMAIAALLLLASGAQGNVSYTDSTFAEGDWTVTVILYGAGGAADVSQNTSGGNPGAYRSYVHTVTPTVASSAAVYVFSMRTGAVYDPAEDGAIASIAYSEDTKTNSLGWGNQIGGAMALRQDAILYYGGYRIDAGSAWTTHSASSLTANDFISLSGTSHPDFSSEGSPIIFGFFRASSQPSGHNWITEVAGGTDNWQVTVTSVPEPTTMSLLIVGLGALAWRKRK